MREMTQQQWDQVSDAIVTWTGKGAFAWPHRDDSRMLAKFGPGDAEELLALVRVLHDEFYASDARLTAPDLGEMGKMASAEFRRKYPRVTPAAVDALAWCYTFDNK
jgi:hypothetical protein